MRSIVRITLSVALLILGLWSREARADEHEEAPAHLEEALPPAPGEPTRGLRVRLLAEGERAFIVHRTVGARLQSYGGKLRILEVQAPACRTPCELLLEPDIHTFSIQNERGKKVRVREMVYLTESADLEFRWQRRRAQRWILAGVALGLTGFGTWALVRGLGGSEPSLALALTGSAVMPIGAAMLVTPLLAFDRGHVQMRPYGSTPYASEIR